MTSLFPPSPAPSPLLSEESRQVTEGTALASPEDVPHWPRDGRGVPPGDAGEAPA